MKNAIEDRIQEQCISINEDMVRGRTDNNTY